MEENTDWNWRVLRDILQKCTLTEEEIAALFSEETTDDRWIRGFTPGHGFYMERSPGKFKVQAYMGNENQPYTQIFIERDEVIVTTWDRGLAEWVAT